MKLRKVLQEPFRIAKIQQKWRFVQPSENGLPELFGNIWLIRRKIKAMQRDILHNENKAQSENVLINSQSENLLRGAFLKKGSSAYIPFDITKHKSIDAILAEREFNGLGFAKVLTDGDFTAFKLAKANNIRWFNCTYALSNYDNSISGLSYMELLEKNGFRIHLSYNSVMELILDYWNNNYKTLKILDENGKERNLFDLIAA